MPQSEELAELRRELQIVKTAWLVHEGECKIRNEQAEASQKNIAGMIGNVVTRVSSLEESRAKFIGWVLGGAIGGSAIGGGAVAGFIKLFGG